MRRILFGLLIAAMGGGLASCVNDDTDMDDIIAQYQIEPASIELDFSDLTEAADVPVTDENDSAYNDYVENTAWTRVIEIEYSNDGATVTGTVPGVTVSTDGAHVTVLNMSSGPVKFVLNGSTADGSLKFYGDKRIQVLLNNVGTTNSLKDGPEYTMVDEEDQKAALFSEGQIIFSGKGRLNVTANGRGGIRSDDYIRIRPGADIYIQSSAQDGLRSNDGIILDGGRINIQTTGSGAKGVRSEGPMTVNGGRLVAISDGDTRITTTDGIDVIQARFRNRV